MKIYDLTAIPLAEYLKVGGKARGLHGLHIAGLNIAKGFVVTDIQNEEDYEKAAGHYARSGLKKVAVRSSASAEDGSDFSNAGQYTTFLDVSGKDDVKEAIRKCVQSLGNVTAASYAGFFNQAKSASMSVVVQEMVDAALAGVCFTQDPLTGKQTILVEAVAGQGEQLVSGSATAKQYYIDNDKLADSQSYEKAVQSAGKMLSPGQLQNICREAAAASGAFETPLDTEWAIDPSGTLYWLQARPITTLDEPDINELDTKLDIANHIITNCNIGEMLPGAVTPLSLSTSVYAIDWGMRKMFVRAGVYRTFDDIPEGSCALSFGNHLFLDLTVMSRMGGKVLAASAEAVELNICGRILEDIPRPPIPKAPALVRANNGRKYFAFLLSRNKARKEIAELADTFRIPGHTSPEGQFAAIDNGLYALNHSFWLHYITSAHSGAMNGALYQILMADMKDPEKVNAAMAGVLEDIDDIESVDILRSLRRLARALIAQNPDIQQYTIEQLAQAMKTCTGEAKEAYDSFISRHGHRAIREAEVRSASWKNDEKGLMDYLRSVIATGGQETVKEKYAEKNIADLLAQYKGTKAKALRYIIGQARTGVKNREFSKSMCIKVFDQFKTAYAGLGEMLVKEGALPDADLIYFLQHKEIGKLVNEKQAGLVKKALARRRLLDEQKLLKYNDVNVGIPKPVTIDLNQAGSGTVLTGSPISRGTATGRARVVRSIEDANKLEKGEIMVAAFTDIGWSPYYCLIGALVTEVGSALSHGAVVAREYALPLVTNVGYATNLIRTGDMIMVNGTNGTITILDADAIKDEEQERVG